MEKQERRYVLMVKKKPIEVTEEVYKTYYKLTERERYLDKLAQKKHVSFEASRENGFQVDYLLSRSLESLEDSVIKQEMLARLTEAIEMLSELERLLIYALFFQGKSERQLAEETDIPQRTINDRKRKILLKLKKLMEK